MQRFALKRSGGAATKLKSVVFLTPGPPLPGKSTTGDFNFSDFSGKPAELKRICVMTHNPFRPRAHPTPHPTHRFLQMEESFDEDGNVIVPYGQGGEGSEGGGEEKKTPKKKARRQEEDEEEDEDDDKDDDDYKDEDDAADPPEDDTAEVGSKRLRGAGGRPLPTLADKAAQATLRVANTMSAEVAAGKVAERAAHEMQKFKDAHPGPVAALLTSAREYVGKQNFTHAQSITFLNNASKGFAVRFHPCSPTPRVPIHNSPTPHTHYIQTWAEVKHAQVKLERAKAARAEAEEAKARADMAAAAAAGGSGSGSGSGSGPASASLEKW